MLRIPFGLWEVLDDKKKADRAIKFIEALRHTKGKWDNQRFWLLPWQEQLVRDIFGIVKDDGTRQFRTAFVEICKKVGKSELAEYEFHQTQAPISKIHALYLPQQITPDSIRHFHNLRFSL